MPHDPLLLLDLEAGSKLKNEGDINPILGYIVNQISHLQENGWEVQSDRRRFQAKQNRTTKTMPNPLLHGVPGFFQDQDFLSPVGVKHFVGSSMEPKGANPGKFKGQSEVMDIFDESKVDETRFSPASQQSFHTILNVGKGVSFFLN